MSLTSEERMVVAAAVVIYIVLNMIMWTAIVLFNRKKRKKNQIALRVSAELPPEAKPGERVLMLQPDENGELQKAFGARKSVPAADEEFLQKGPGDNFRIVRSIIIVHSDERIK